MEDQNTSKTDPIPFWLTMRKYCITKSLNHYLNSHPLSEEEKKELCFIQNEVLKLSDRIETDDQGYVRIHRHVFFDKCGPSYTKRLSLLVSIGELEIDHSYCFLSEESTPAQIQTHVPKCKGFKVPHDKISQGLVSINFKLKRVNPLKKQDVFLSSSQKREEEGREDICAGLKSKKDILCPDKAEDVSLMNYMLECLNQVSVSRELILPEDPLRASMVKSYAERTYFKSFGLRRAKSGRVFHSIIESPKEGRINLKHVSGRSFVDIDIKTCHPHLLLNQFNDVNERNRFYADLSTDFYSRINATQHRDRVKKRTCQYLMCKKRDAEWLKGLDVHSYFKTHYPTFFREVLSSDNGLAAKLQGLESDIVTRDLVRYCMEHKLFIITMHDGCLTLPEHKDAIMDKLKELLRQRTGYKVSVEEKTSVVPKATNENKTVSPLRIKKDNSHNERKVKHMKRKKEEPQSNQVQIIEFIAGVLRRWKEIGVSDNELKRREEYVIKRIQEQPPLDIYEASALMRRAQLL